MCISYMQCSIHVDQWIIDNDIRTSCMQVQFAETFTQNHYSFKGNSQQIGILVPSIFCSTTSEKGCLAFISV